MLICLSGIVLTTAAVAQEFPWQPASPPVYAPTEIKPVEVPKIEPPAQIVPGHKGPNGYVPSYSSSVPVVPPLAPGVKSSGWVPGYHDAKGAWVPGHPQ